MLFALTARDKAGALEVRKANRDAHVAYLKATDAVEMAGPFLDAEGNMCGSLIVPCTGPLRCRRCRRESGRL